MKKMMFLAFLAISTFTAVQAQDLKKVLKEHFEATGQEKLVKAEDVVMKGRIMQMGIEIPFTSMMMRPGMMRTEGTFQGMTFIQTFNGSEGWSINPFAGAMEPQPMGPDEVKAMKQQADIDGMLWNYDEKGYKVELKGSEEVEGTDCFKVQIITPENDIHTYFIDKDSYMCIKTASAVQVQGVPQESEMLMSDFKEVDGIVFPGSIETRYAGQTAMVMVFDEIKLNTKPAKDLFEKPAN